jgi:hypothetical protein
LGYLKERDQLKNISINRRIILKYIVKNVVEECGLDIFGLEYDPVAGCCKDSNKISSSMI